MDSDRPARGSRHPGLTKAALLQTVGVHTPLGRSPLGVLCNKLAGGPCRRVRCNAFEGSRSCASRYTSAEGGVPGRLGRTRNFATACCVRKFTTRWCLPLGLDCAHRIVGFRVARIYNPAGGGVGMPSAGRDLAPMLDVRIFSRALSFLVAQLWCSPSR